MTAILVSRWGRVQGAGLLLLWLGADRLSHDHTQKLQDVAHANRKVLSALKTEDQTSGNEAQEIERQKTLLGNRACHVCSHTETLLTCAACGALATDSLRGTVATLVIRHRPAIAGAFATVVLVSLGSHVFKRWESAATQESDNLRRRRDMAERTLALLSSFRASLWELRSNCLPRATSARGRIASGAVQAEKEISNASLDACTKTYQQLTHDYIGWTWQVSFLLEDIVNLPPCAERPGSLLQDEPRLEADPERNTKISCNLLKCDRPLSKMAAFYDAFTLAYERYSAHYAAADHRGATDCREWNELVKATEDFMTVTRRLGCALAIAGNRQARDRRYKDPLGYCDDALKTIPVFDGGTLRDPEDPAAKRWCESAKVVNSADAGFTAILWERCASTASAPSGAAGAPP